MAFAHTLSGAVDTDPLFDRRSLLPGYHDWHECEAVLDDREPIPGASLVVSCRAFVRYTDAGDVEVRRVEILDQPSMEDLRRGRRVPSRLAPAGLAELLLADARSAACRAEVVGAVEAHQADRD